MVGLVNRSRSACRHRLISASRAGETEKVTHGPQHLDHTGPVDLAITTATDDDYEAIVEADARAFAFTPTPEAVSYTHLTLPTTPYV